MPFSSKNIVFGLLAFCALHIASSSTTYAWTVDCSTVNIPQIECEALRDLYNSTNGSGWVINGGWGVDTDVNNRYGVQTFLGRVIALNLQLNNLSGTLPESLSGLSTLQGFNVSSNFITGTLPESLKDWTSLIGFRIGSNQIQGTLPDSRSAWTSLTVFDANSNQLTGTLPDSRSSWTGMSEFNLGFNSIHGILPASRSAWTGMSNFTVASNQLVGSLPSSRESWSTIGYFDIQNNQFVGSLPSSRSSWSSISYFYASNNQINGVLPSSRSAWTTINRFYIANNKITGVLPSSRSAWTTISTLSVEDNLLSGFIPSSWYPDRYNLATNISSFNNCMQTTGYDDFLVQDWVDNSISDEPQNDCSVPTPIILLPISGEVFTTGTLTINGTGEIGYTITMTVNSTIFTGIIDGSGLRSFSLSNMSNGIYNIIAFQTNPVSTYNSNTASSSFTIAIPITSIPSPTPSGGGGAGGASLQKDNCPAGDNSASYYDKDCGKDSTENVLETSDKKVIFTRKCQYNDGEFELYKTSMTDIKGKKYEQAVINLLGNCLIHGESNKGRAYKGEEPLRYGALYKIVYRLIGKPIEIPARQKHWSDIYYTEGAKLGLREGLSVPKNPDMLVGGIALQKVIRNIFDYGPLNNPELETSLKSKTYNSLIIKRGTFAIIISELLKQTAR